jgi:hypothetical protein
MSDEIKKQLEQIEASISAIGEAKSAAARANRRSLEQLREQLLKALSELHPGGFQYPVPLMCFPCGEPQTFYRGGDAKLHCSVCHNPLLVQKLDGDLVEPGRQHYMGKDKKEEKPKEEPKHVHNYVDQKNGWKRCSCGSNIHAS